MHYKTVRNLWINMNFDNMRKKVKDKHKITNVKMYIKSIPCVSQKSSPWF